MVYNKEAGKVGRRKSIIRIKPQKVEEEVQEEIHHGDEKVIQEDITKYWKEYTNKMKPVLGGFSSSILANCEPKLLDDSKTIHLIFRNETNELEFNKLSGGVLGYLKKNVRNNFITFSTEISKTKAKKVLYTNRDKFDHFAKTHPKLKEWEQKLGLELK